MELSTGLSSVISKRCWFFILSDQNILLINLKYSLISLSNFFIKALLTIHMSEPHKKTILTFNLNIFNFVLLCMFLVDYILFAVLKVVPANRR